MDLLVDIRQEKKTFQNYLSIVYFLEDLFENKVDLITEQSLSKHIGPNILETVEYISYDTVKTNIPELRSCLKFIQ
ncbi:nucleotidyltransferase family protein [Mucilaginibacter arboris]|uniref:Uncharacterized protein n=1 Tax=Mucilaginibacter arboris TaxID=2682090 RepID=A0A7K1STH6_9SPHI|nr:hypothetical protein [Mucilaginibacter arboris]